MNVTITWLIRCPIVRCPKMRTTSDLTGNQFCPEHQVDFEASPEGKHVRPSSASDFRDRVWKTQCAVDVAAKVSQAELELKAKKP